MLVAIIAGIVTLVVIIGVVVFVLSRRNSDRAGRVTPSHSMNSINTVVSASSKQKSTFGAPQVAHTRTPSGSPSDQLQSRFVAMGVLAAAVFGSLAAKLWSMQIMQAATYARQAEANLYTTVYTPAPRASSMMPTASRLCATRASSPSWPAPMWPKTMMSANV